MVMMLTFVIIQAGLYYHARTVAQNAAQIGMESARTFGSDGAAGQSSASSFINQVSPGLLKNVQINVAQGDLVTVRVKADGPALVPGFPMPGIDVAAAGPAERLTQP